MNVRRFIRHTLTVARREFMTAVSQPTFLIFLLSPLIILVISMVSGGAMDAARTQTLSKRSVVMLAQGGEAMTAKAVDARLRSLAMTQQRGALRTEAPSMRPAQQARELLSEDGSNVAAVLYGPLRRPSVVHTPDGVADARYLAQIADETYKAIRMREMASREGADAGPRPAQVVISRPTSASANMAEGLGALAIVFIFIATYLLSSHIATGFAEERSSKIIEILASSASLESVFFGKLLGELAVATLFTAFWLTVLIGVALAGALPVQDGEMSSLMAATGILFAPLFLVYFVLSYLICSCTILGIASLASTPRGAAIMIMPFTVMQFGMMSMASYAGTEPGTPLFWFAAAVPYSSPLVMVSQAATSASLGIHAAAILWQLLCVVVIVRLAAKAFRRGALGAGGRGISLRKAAA